MTTIRTDAEPAGLRLGALDEARKLLAEMVKIRIFEDEVMKLFSNNLVRGSTHLCQGQEAVSVGVAAALVKGDTMTCTYRGHGAVLAMGAPLDRSFGEILGKANGLCGGRAGSMHLTDASVGALGSNAIVGANLPIAVGAALSAQVRGTGSVAVAFCGDGATNIGAFHESLNMAAIWKLPVFFVIENNQYGEYSPLASTTPIHRLADRAASYGMPGVLVDGNDVYAVRQTAAEARQRARDGAGPTLIEANTYRQCGHSRSDPATYRPAGELDYWLARDPIARLESAMRAAGESAEVINQVRQSASADVMQAEARALAWADAAADQRLQEVFA